MSNILQEKLDSFKRTKEYRVLELNSKGLTNEQIVKELGGTVKSILSILTKYSVKSNRHEAIVETNELTQLILGSILGDGSLSKLAHGKHQSRLRVAHCLEQEEYCRWKASILKKYNLLSQVCYSHTFDSRFKEPDYTIIKISSIAHPIFTKYRNKSYSNNKSKSLPCEELENLDPLGLAVWYMDDGCKTGNSMVLCTNSFSRSELEFLVTLLKRKFDLDFTIQKTGALYLRVSSWSRFRDLVRKHITPCMRYKIRQRVLYKEEELLES